jgi:hypothetical protein
MASFLAGGCGAETGEAPEAQAILQVQKDLPFQVLIPAYLPEGVDRARAQVLQGEPGPKGEPLLQIVYPAQQGAALFARQWVPNDPRREVLAGSRAIATKWGEAALLERAGRLAALWVDVGALRVALYSPNPSAFSAEQLVQIAESLGPVSGRRVSTKPPAKAPVRDAPLPPALEVPTTAQGIQELTLVITPAGYSPRRFAVKKGVPVRLTFRAAGRVGCGNELLFPARPGQVQMVTLASEFDTQVLEFTPQQAGDFKFNCSHDMYRGIMTVRD